LYIGTLSGSGLLHVDFETEKVKAFPYDFNEKINADVFMRDLAWGSDSQIYIASTAGLLQFDVETKTFRKFDELDSINPGVDVTSVCRCKEALWAGSNQFGIFQIDESGLHDVIRHSGVNNITKIRCGNIGVWVGTKAGLFQLEMKTGVIKSFIEDIQVTDIVVVQDTTWVSSLGEGLFRLLEEDKSTVTHQVSHAGGGTNFIYNMTFDDKGGLWLNTDGGTVRYDPSRNSYTNYRELGDGKRPPIVQLSDGRMVTGGYASISHFMLEDLEVRGIPPKPYISNINIANRKEQFEFGPNQVNQITLSPRERELFIEFNAINFNSIPTTEFHYRVLGLGDDWKNILDRRFLSLNNLDPGDYQFELRAKNIYGGFSEVNKRIDILVLPPFYKTWQGQLLIFCSILAIGFLAYWRRSKIVEQKLFLETINYFSNSRYAENAVDEILWDLARNVISRLNFEDCVVYLYDKKTNSLVQKAAYGVKNPKGREILHPVQIQIGKGIVGSAAAQKSPIIVSDVTRDPRYIQDIEVNGSELSVPILHQNEIVGVIDSEHSKKGFFKQRHANVLLRIANECAHKIAAAVAAEEIEKKEMDLLAIQKESAESKLTALQAQMNPHFIFNSLNSINWYILKSKPAQASLYLTKFSKLVRLILDNSKKLSIPLNEELEAMRLYLDLESMRFDDVFEYEIQTDDAIDLEEAVVPPLILQPFVENAIWHGLMHKKEKGHLMIQIYRENDQLKCVVQDDGVGRHASQRLKPEQAVHHQSKGIKLTTDRINLLGKTYLKEDMVRIIDLVDSESRPLGTRVEVSLPYEE
jgi:putative methionine-R-sulfoxide reductase with GAF domain